MSEKEEIEHPGEISATLEAWMRRNADARFLTSAYYDPVTEIPVSVFLELLDRVRIMERRLDDSEPTPSIWGDKGKGE